MDITTGHIDILESSSKLLNDYLKSREGERIESQKEDYTIVYGYQFFRTLQNLLRVIPYSLHYQFVEHEMNQYNLSSIASFTRNLWDILIGFVFHIVDAPTQERFEYKTLLQHYLAENKRYELVTNLGVDHPDVLAQRELVSEAFSKLEQRSEYQGLPEKVKTDISGNRFSPPARLLLPKIGIPVKYYSALQTYLSNHTHYFAYGFTQDLVFNTGCEDSQITMKMVFGYAEVAVLFFLQEFFRELERTISDTNFNRSLDGWCSYFSESMWSA